MRVALLSFSFALGLLLYTVTFTPAYAQNKKITSQELGVLAFYKITGLSAPIDHWIKNSQIYKSMPAATAKQYYEEEKLRLQWGLGTFNPNEDYLSIRTKINTTLIEKGDEGFMVSNFPERSALDPPFFPHNIENIWVALILKDIKKFMTVEVGNQIKERLAAYLTPEQPSYILDLDIVVRVLSGDRKKIKIDGIEQYSMLGDIAHISFNFPEFHQSKDKLLWEYHAPWYMDQNEIDLLKILDGQNQ